jgi:plasmid maintenance system killer protein
LYGLVQSHAFARNCAINKNRSERRLHPLEGELNDLWTVTVRANWRVIFRFRQGDATDVDYWITTEKGH